MDATSAFHELRDRYRDRIDAFFDAFMGRSIDLAHDRAILRDLLSLAPPGIDELYALASLGETLEARRYATIVVDPAPTGHLLRLLQLPAVAIEWSHRLMRLIMKYKEIGGLSESAQEIVTFSRRTRALDALLHDPARAGVVLVSLNEPAVTAETARLTELLRQTGIAVLGEVRNRIDSAIGPDQGIVAAPEFEGRLVGIAAIREWARRWQQSGQP
jgi:arsenite-transporting ATPase